MNRKKIKKEFQSKNYNKNNKNLIGNRVSNVGFALK
jgi:hypothetical protein